MKQLIKTTILLLAILLPAIATAHDFEVDGIYYNRIDSDEVEVTYRGRNLLNNDYSGTVNIPASVTYNETAYSVTAIDSLAFWNCPGLTSIVIPNSVTEIGQEAFAKCPGLTSIVVESSNPKFDSRDNCNAIIETASNTLIAGCKNTTIPNSVTAIGDFAFQGCDGLTSIVIPNSVTVIGWYAFESCDGLTSIVIPNSVTEIGYAAFDWCTELSSIVVESGNPIFDSRDNCNAIIETADNTLIVGCKNTTIPNSVTAIGDFAFYSCHGLTSIVIPNSVTVIGYAAFDSCSGLTSINIGNSVTAIGDYAFDKCNALTSIDIPNSVIEIGNGAFAHCSGLTSVDIPNSVTSIGDRAFLSCWRVTSINIPNSVTAIGNETFSGSGLTSIVIPNSVTSIGDKAFYNCSALTSVDIPNSVTSIGARAFGYCSGLTSIVIPNSVTAIGEHAFYNCKRLTSIVVESGNPIFDSRNNCNAIIETASNTLIVGCNNTMIPNSVTAIGQEALAYYKGLTSIVIPNSVTSIGQWAFTGCTGLTDVYCYIADLSRVSSGKKIFYLNNGDYSGRTLHVLQGTADAYRADENWYPYFGQIVEDIFMGDVNGDLEVNIADVNVAIDMILGGNSSTPAADVNGDGEINIADINAVIDIILNSTGN